MPVMGTIKITLPDELRDELRTHAAKEDRSESAIIRRALREHFDRNRKAAAAPRTVETDLAEDR